MKKKPVKKSGPSTGGKVTSRVNESDSKNKKVPVTSVTPKSTTAKASKKTMTGARKVVGAVAATAIPAAKVASNVGKSKAAKAALDKVISDKAAKFGMSPADFKKSADEYARLLAKITKK
jgi:hypothetical protein